MPKLRLSEPTDRPYIDWAEYEGTSPGSLKINSKVRTKGKDKVFSHMSYAQELYNKYNNYNDVEYPVVGAEIEGEILSVSSSTVRMNIGWREDAIIDLKKDTSFNADDYNVGDKIQVVVEKVDPKNVFAPVVSHTKAALKYARNLIMDSIGKSEAYPGIVEEMIDKAGYTVNIGGVKCFMPGSLADMNKLVDFTSVIGKMLYVIPINYSTEKDCIIVSHRDYLKAMIPSKMDEIKEGDRIEGFVTGTSSHGIFIQFNECLTGLIPKSEINKAEIDNFMNIKPGTLYSCYIKDINDRRIVLSDNEPGPSPWDDAEEMVGTIVLGRVKMVVDYGVFIEIKPKMTGLLHKSQIKSIEAFQVGNKVQVLIDSVDSIANWITLVLPKE